LYFKKSASRGRIWKRLSAPLDPRSVLGKDPKNYRKKGNEKIQQKYLKR